MHKRDIIELDMVIWDYFMRRKWLLLMTLSIFLLSGMVSGYFLKRSDTYVVNTTVLNQPDTIENNSSATAARINVPILSEEESAAAEEIATIEKIIEAESVMDDMAPDNSINSIESEFDVAQQTRPEEIDVPLTGGSQIEASAAWKSLFVAWQQITWSIFGAVVVALLVVLLARWTFWHRIR